MDAAYTSIYARLYRGHWWWRVREHILISAIRQLAGGRAGALRILDVGCGAGLFFDALEPFGHVEGIESDEIAVQQSGRWRSRIHHGSLETFGGRGFDLALLLDVIEHVDDPKGLLQQVASLLTPGGVVLITVPAFRSLWTSHDDLNHHRTRYRAAELRRLMQAAGLDVVETRYLFQSLALAKLLVRARETFAPSTNTLPKIPASPINKAVQAWFHLEHACAGWLPFGSSVMAVAHVGGASLAAAQVKQGA